MAEKKATSAGVQHVVNDDGSHSIGVKVDKQFVPFVTLDAYRVEQLRENAENSGTATSGNGEGGEE